MLVARDSGTVALLAPLHPGAADFEADRARQKARKEAGVSAMLYETYPIRYWDHYLGPREPRYFVADAPADDDAPLGTAEDLTGPTGAALPEPELDIAPDGRSLATTWRRYKTGATGDDIVVIDRATRERRDLTGGVGWSGRAGVLARRPAARDRPRPRQLSEGGRTTRAGGLSTSTPATRASWRAGSIAGR